MKLVQYINAEGRNAYVPSDRIVQIIEEGLDQSKILLSHGTDTPIINLKPVDLINRVYKDKELTFEIIQTDPDPTRPPKMEMGNLMSLISRSVGSPVEEDNSEL